MKWIYDLYVTKKGRNSKPMSQKANKKWISDHTNLRPRLQQLLGPDPPIKKITETPADTEPMGNSDIGVFGDANFPDSPHLQEALAETDPQMATLETDAPPMSANGQECVDKQSKCSEICINKAIENSHKIPPQTRPLCGSPNERTMLVVSLHRASLNKASNVVGCHQETFQFCSEDCSRPSEINNNRE